MAPTPGAPVLTLDPDELLSTTRAVRKRLDLGRPVADELIRECVAMAMQAPCGSNNSNLQFVVVRDADKRRALGELYRQCYGIYSQMDGIYIGSIDKGDPDANAQQQRSTSSADLLADRMGDAPVLVVPCIVGRTDGMPGMVTSSLMGNVLPATWSFMLAARARGLGTCWTTVHLMMEEQAAEILGVPFAEVQQVCLTPVAHTVGTDFRPAQRPAPDTIIRWDGW